MSDDATYKDEDFVYVDTANRKVMGLVQWDKDGKPIPMEKVIPDKEEGDEEGGEKETKRRPKKMKKQYYIWGSYGSMKKLYKLAPRGDAEQEEYISLDVAMEKSKEEPYWD